MEHEGIVLARIRIGRAVAGGAAVELAEFGVPQRIEFELPGPVHF